VAEEERTPEGRQADEIRTRAFSEWYELKKASVEVTTDPSLTGSES